MMKINITLDVSKFNKDKIVDSKFTKQDGTEVTSKNYKVELIALKEEKTIKEGDTWIMKKTHFVVEAQTKEERERKDPANYVGEGFQFFDKTSASHDAGVDEDIPVDEIPF